MPFALTSESVWAAVVAVSATLPAGAFLAKMLLPAYINAKVDEAVKKRLAAHQLDLDKDLEAHKATLTRQTETLKGVLQRSATDYGIYAQKRHTAVAELFAAFLRAEAKANDRTGPEGGAPHANDVAQSNLIIERVIAARNEAQDAFFAHALYLPSSLSTAATAVRDAFHDVFVEYVSPTDRPNVDRGKALKHLHEMLQLLLTASRRELSQSSDAPSAS
jgi:hypothetical protein